MPRRLPSVIAALLLAALPTGVQAQLSAAPRIGTLGLGVDVGLGVLPVVTVRGGIGFIPVEPRGTFDDIEYDVSVPGALTLGLDLHPGGGSFRLSAGLMRQHDDLTLEGTPSEAVEVGDETYSPEEIGTLRGALNAPELSPFATLGFGKHGQPGLGLFLDLGVAFLGDPDISLSADGDLADDPSFESALRTEEARIEDDMDVYGRFYPIVNLGLRIGLGR